MNDWQVLPGGALVVIPRLSFPLCGNDLFQPLDSGLRRNDGVASRKDVEDH